jgi:hypothetical protein
MCGALGRGAARRGAILALTTGDQRPYDPSRYRFPVGHDRCRRTRDPQRFPHPCELMGYLGLVPSEHSSGPTQHRGELTRTGNTHVRRILIEAEWNYRFATRVGESLQPRLEGRPQNIMTIAWKVQVRLCARFHRLRARGIHHNKATAAIARERCGIGVTRRQQFWRIGNAATGTIEGNPRDFFVSTRA